jgi:hypothetical protein
MKDKYYLSMMSYLGVFTKPLEVTEVIKDVLHNKVTLWYKQSNGVKECVVYCCECLALLDKNIEVDEDIVFISEDKEKVQAWIDGYKASCKILKEFIHI